MKALVYQGPGKKSWEEKPQPTILKPTDAITARLVDTVSTPMLLKTVNGSGGKKLLIDLILRFSSVGPTG